MNYDQFNLWYGTEETRNNLMKVLSKALKSPQLMTAANTQFATNSSNNTDDNPVSYQVIGNIAVLGISGGMMTDSSPLTRYFGIITYQDIQSRIYQAAEDASVKAVVNNYNTAGGAAIGTSALASTIRTVNDTIKPVISYTDREALSSGYWLASAGAKLYAGEDASLGSIGAIAIHTDQSKARQADGLTDTVFRSAPYKALLNPIEPLSDKAKQVGQDMVDTGHQKFVFGISTLRGMNPKAVNDTIANGKTYTSQQALDMKMIDGIMSFEMLLAKMMKGVK